MDYGEKLSNVPWWAWLLGALVGGGGIATILIASAIGQDASCKIYAAPQAEGKDVWNKLLAQEKFVAGKVPRGFPAGLVVEFTEGQSISAEDAGSVSLTYEPADAKPVGAPDSKKKSSTNKEESGSALASEADFASGLTKDVTIKASLKGSSGKEIAACETNVQVAQPVCSFTAKSASITLGAVPTFSWNVTGVQKGKVSMRRVVAGENVNEVTSGGNNTGASSGSSSGSSLLSAITNWFSGNSGSGSSGTGSSSGSGTNSSSGTSSSSSGASSDESNEGQSSSGSSSGAGSAAKTQSASLDAVQTWDVDFLSDKDGSQFKPPAPETLGTYRYTLALYPPKSQEVLDCADSPQDTAKSLGEESVVREKAQHPQDVQVNAQAAQCSLSEANGQSEVMVGDTVSVKWDSGNTVSGTLSLLSPGDQTATKETLSKLKDQRDFTLAKSGSYVFTFAAQGGAGAEACSKSLAIKAVNKLGCWLKAQPAAPKAGDKVTLSWGTEQAAQAFLKQDGGTEIALDPVAAGDMQFTAEQTTLFTVALVPANASGGSSGASSSGAAVTRQETACSLSVQVTQPNISTTLPGSADTGNEGASSSGVSNSTSSSSGG